MLPARRALLQASLAAMDSAVLVLADAEAHLAEDPTLAELLALQPLLRLRRRALPAPLDLAGLSRPHYRLTRADEPDAARAGFLGFPQGFLLDAFCDLAVALSRRDPHASPLAREVLDRLARPVEALVLTTPG